MRWGREGVLVTHCSAFLSQCLTLCAAFDTIFSDTIFSIHLILYLVILLYLSTLYTWGGQAAT